MRARRAGGFTLLEVLGAVLVIGVAFTLLAAANIEGLRAEGVARRELEASLVADRTLARIEADLVAGTVPQMGVEQEESDGYRVRVEVTPLQVGLPPLPPEAPPELADEPGAPSLLVSPGGGTPTPLRHVEIRVTWDDGSFEHSVERETFVFDVAAAQSLLGPLQEAGAGAGLP